MPKKLKVILIASFVILLLGVSFRVTKLYIDYKYENGIFDAPNFDDESNNYAKLEDSIEETGVVHPGELISYQIFYKNTGKILVQDLKIEVILPGNCKLIEKYLKDYSYGYNAESKKVVFGVGSLGIRKEGKIKLTLKIDYPLDNGIKISPPEIDFKYFKINEAIEREGHFEKKLQIPSRLVVMSSPEFGSAYIGVINKIREVNESGILEITKGDEIEYEVFVFNNGNMNAKDVSLIVEGLDNLTVIEDDKDTFELKESNIIWDIPLFKAGELFYCRFKAKVNDDVENGFEIAPFLRLIYRDEEIIKTSERVIVKLFPSFEKSLVVLVDQNGGNTYSGELVSANINIVNSGDIKANNVIAKLILSNLFSSYEGSLSWQIESLDIDKSVSFSTFIKVIDGITQNSYASCKLQIASDEIDSRITSNSSLLISGSKPFTRNYIPIISLHGIKPDPQGRYEISTEAFEYLLSLLKSYGYETITFADLLNYIDYGKTLPEKPVIITSDDGYQSIYTYAFPILKKYSYKMTVFLITGYIGDSESTRRLNEFDEVGGKFNIPSRLMLIWPEIVRMSRYGCEFLSHTWSHGIISNMPGDDALKELVQSKSDIETHIGKPVLFVAWPHGAFSSQVIGLLPQAGYRGSVGYGGGVEDIRTLNIYNIKRVKIVSEISPLVYAELLKLE